MSTGVRSLCRESRTSLNRSSYDEQSIEMIANDLSPSIDGQVRFGENSGDEAGGGKKGGAPYLILIGDADRDRLGCLLGDCCCSCPLTILDQRDPHHVHFVIRCPHCKVHMCAIHSTVRTHTPFRIST